MTLSGFLIGMFGVCVILGAAYWISHSKEQD